MSLFPLKKGTLIQGAGMLNKREEEKVEERVKYLWQQCEMERIKKEGRKRGT